MLWEFEPGFMFNKPSDISKLAKGSRSPEFQGDV